MPPAGTLPTPRSQSQPLGWSWLQPQMGHGAVLTFSSYSGASPRPLPLHLSLALPFNQLPRLTTTTGESSWVPLCSSSSHQEVPSAPLLPVITVVHVLLHSCRRRSSG